MGAVIAIDYGAMSDAERAARRAADKCESYVNHINKKVCQKISSLTMGGNGNTSQADYFARSKINSLNQKKSRYEQFAARVGEAKSYAKDTDSSVSRYIKRAANDFRSSHDMKVGVIAEFFAWATTTLLNKTAFGRFLNQISRGLNAWIHDIKRNFKSWYELDGGKYIVTLVGTVILTAISAVFLICVAWPMLAGAAMALIGSFIAGSAVSGIMIWTAITAAAAFTSAFIAVLDGFVKIIYNRNAILANENDPGWARCFSNYSSFSDFLRKNNFHDPYSNKISGLAANIVDALSIAADLINFADLARNGVHVLKNLKTTRMNIVFNKVHFKYPNGKMTLGSVKYGIKNVIHNTGQFKKLVTTTNLSRMNQYYSESSRIYQFIEKMKIKGKVDTVTSLLHKGCGTYLKDKIIGDTKKKITGNLTSLEFSSKIKDINEKIEKLNKANKPIFPSEPQVSMAGG